MRNHRRIVFNFCVLLAAIAFQTQVVCSSPLAPALYAFGDSLFDSGNNNQLPTLGKANFLPYGNNFPGGATGRFTNGRTIPDFFAEFLGLPYPPPYLSSKTSEVITGMNFASGACGILPETGNVAGKCLTLDDQVTLFESYAANDLPGLLKSSDELSSYLAKSIFAFSIGSNDYIINYLQPLFYNSSKTYKPQPFAKHLAASYSQYLERFYNAGARKFVVFDVGPIGCVPSMAHDGVCDGERNLVVSYFNQMLQPMLENMTSSLAGSMFVLGRANELGYDAIINPTLYGMTDSRNPCCTSWLGTLLCIPLQTPCPKPDKHFFWDGYHLTEAVYSLLASRCINDNTVCSPVSIQELVQIETSQLISPI